MPEQFKAFKEEKLREQMGDTKYRAYIRRMKNHQPEYGAGDG